MRNEVETFYDDFSETFIRDYIYGNLRVDRQLKFLSNALPHDVSRVLIIGCGCGQSAHFIATRVAKHAKVLAVDISGEVLRLAKALFRHDRVEYRKLDITSDPIEGEWDAIVLPDVYEHIPLQFRKVLHSKLNSLLSNNGKILFTLPSPAHQAFLYESGKGLQLVDEIVTLQDLVDVAKDIRGQLTYFRMISLGNTNDYIHAVIERGTEKMGPLRKADKLPIKGWSRGYYVHRGCRYLLRKLGLQRLRQWRRRRRVPKVFLKKGAVQ